MHRSSVFLRRTQDTAIGSAKFRRSERMSCREQIPLSVRIRSPIGSLPHAGLPSGSLVEVNINFQVPTSCSFSDFC